VLFCCQRCNRIERINAQLLLHDERALSKNRKVLSMRLTAYGLCSQCSIKLQGL
jgi:Fe2+ or Zn2+ uptake regulation protein